MRVLITNMVLDGRTGTETYTRDLALGLQAAGSDPIVYSPQLGKIAEEIVRAGIPVTARLRTVSPPPDIIHGHHNLPLLDALREFPRVPALFVCHDRHAWHDSPPLVAGVERYVAVDLNCRERLATEGRVPSERIRLILNSVDLARFKPRCALPATPRRALVFSRQLSQPARLRPLKEACESFGVVLDALGFGSGNESDFPESVLPEYDLVFAKARCALEALAVGCSVILCDTAGLGPIVASDQLGELRAWNLGARLLRNPIETGAIRREMGRYDAADATRVSDLIRQEASLEKMIGTYLDLYEETFDEHRTGRSPTPGELQACEDAIRQLRWNSPLPAAQLSPAHELRRLFRRVVMHPQSYLRRLLIGGEIRRFPRFLWTLLRRGAVSGR